jgi:hypothetical protein
MPSERMLVPFRVARGIPVAGLCSQCRRPFRVPLAVESKAAVDRAHRRITAKFKEYACDDDFSQAAAELSTDFNQ